MRNAWPCLLVVACGAPPPNPPPAAVALVTPPPPPAPPELSSAPPAALPTKINPDLPRPDRARVLAVTGEKVLLQLSAERTYFAVLDGRSLCVEETLQVIPAQRFGLVPVPLELHFELKMEDDTPAAIAPDGSVLYATLRGNQECAMKHDLATKKTTRLGCARARGGKSFGVSPHGNYYVLVDRTAGDNVLTVYRASDKKPVLKQHRGNLFVEPSSFLGAVLDDAGHAAWNEYNDFGTFTSGMLDAKPAFDRDNGSAVGFLPDGSVLVLGSPDEGSGAAAPSADSTLAGNACNAFRRAAFEPLVEPPKAPRGAGSNSTPSP